MLEIEEDLVEMVIESELKITDIEWNNSPKTPQEMDSALWRINSVLIRCGEGRQNSKQ